jgi:hypothetical protein
MRPPISPFEIFKQVLRHLLNNSHNNGDKNDCQGQLQFPAPFSGHDILLILLLGLKTPGFIALPLCGTKKQKGYTHMKMS